MRSNAVARASSGMEWEPRFADAEGRGLALGRGFGTPAVTAATSLPVVTALTCDDEALGPPGCGFPSTTRGGGCCWRPWGGAACLASGTDLSPIGPAPRPPPPAGPLPASELSSIGSPVSAPGCQNMAATALPLRHTAHLPQGPVVSPGLVG